LAQKEDENKKNAKRQIINIQSPSMETEEKGSILLYQTDNGETKIEVTLSNETVWLRKICHFVNELYDMNHFVMLHVRVRVVLYSCYFCHMCDYLRGTGSLLRGLQVSKWSGNSLLPIENEGSPL
jgi:hypothetical protein